MLQLSIIIEFILKGINSKHNYYWAYTVALTWTSGAIAMDWLGQKVRECLYVCGWLG